MAFSNQMSLPVVKDLSGANRVADDSSACPTTSRPQQRYDHRLRALVQRTGNLCIATDLGVQRSTTRGWLGAMPRAVVSLDGAHLTE
jgi:hypothetical protein